MCSNLLSSLVTTISFSLSRFIVRESSRSARVELALSNPLSSNISVEVIDSNITALSEHYKYEIVSNV